ncbi:MAG: YkgJ family cysteine cluster protein [Thermoanaerobaculia bacterium]
MSQTDPKTARIKVLKNLYDCLQCPAYCCSYTRIDVSKRDIARIARHFDLEPDVAEKKFTKLVEGHKALRHQKDKIFGTICQFIDKETRRCTVYEARPDVCRTYPETRRCGYFDFLKWEREHQEDEDFIPYELG